MTITEQNALLLVKQDQTLEVLRTIAVRLPLPQVSEKTNEHQKTATKPSPTRKAKEFLLEWLRWPNATLFYNSEAAAAYLTAAYMGSPPFLQRGIFNEARRGDGMFAAVKAFRWINLSISRIHSCRSRPLPAWQRPTEG